MTTEDRGDAAGEALKPLPCPFCGDEAVIDHDSQLDGGTYYVKCLGCCAFGTNARMSSGAIAAWNRRAAIPGWAVTEDEVERVAFAIHTVGISKEWKHDAQHLWNTMAAEMRENHRKMARAAIAAVGVKL